MKRIKDYNIEGKTIKEVTQGTHYFYLTFTDGTQLDLDVKGDAYIDYVFDNSSETKEIDLSRKSAIEQAISSLEWYANPESYKRTGGGLFAVMTDEGYIAKRALQLFEDLTKGIVSTE